MLYPLESIIDAKTYAQLFPDLNNWEPLYLEIIKEIHPDVCSDPRSSEATAKLLQFKRDITEGILHSDDIGDIVYTPTQGLIHSHQINLIRKSLVNYKTIKYFNDPHFNTYIPDTYELFQDDNIKLTFPKRAIPLSSVGVLEQVHVNWVIRRLLEFTTWLHNMGYTHNGLTPDSIYIVPEMHGIIVTSFYHMVPKDSKLATISGKYAHFYPQVTFDEKIAYEEIDLELIKRIGAYLFGDESGNSSKFSKTHLKPYIDFLLDYDTDSYQCYIKYRDLLKKHFKTHFYPLNI